MLDSSDGVRSDSAGDGFSRRSALKRGALIGGAALWAAPAVQALSMTSAAAQTASPTDSPQATGKFPSHAIFLVVIEGVTYGLKLDVMDASPFDKIPKSDATFLAGKGFTWSDPTAAVLAPFAGRGSASTDTQNEAALKVSLPAGAALVPGSAYSKDGGLQNCGLGDMYQLAAVSGSVLIFYGACHE